MKPLAFCNIIDGRFVLHVLAVLEAIGGFGGVQRCSSVRYWSLKRTDKQRCIFSAVFDSYTQRSETGPEFCSHPARLQSYTADDRARHWFFLAIIA